MAEENEIGRLHLAVDEDAEKARELWKKYGIGIVAGVVLGIGGVVGIHGWRDYVDDRGERASTLYESMVTAVRSKDSGGRDVAEELLADYSNTPYGVGAALMLARLELQAGNAAAAKAQLNWVLENTTEASFRHAATLRLARIALHERDYDSARALLQPSGDSFQSMYDELRGDILAHGGDRRAAQIAYDAALIALTGRSGARDLLQVKRDRIATD